MNRNQSCSYPCGTADSRSDWTRSVRAGRLPSRTQRLDRGAGTRAVAVAVKQRAAPGRRPLVGPDDLEALADEDVVRPADADVVDLVLAVAQLHDSVDDASR